MSYLSLPRLVFAGQFQADPSTVNNDPEHFDDRHFQSSYQLLGNDSNFSNNGWWNPAGTGSWRLRHCQVTSVCYQDGSQSVDPNYDPVIGLPLTDADNRVAGKIVDLDPEQQMVSQLWGFSVTLGPAGSPIRFRGDFAVAPFADIWCIVNHSGFSNSTAAAYYQSVLENLNWFSTDAAQSGSRFLRELFQHAAGAPARLSIKFNIDGYDDEPDSAGFTFGRIVGCIGLSLDGEPRHFVPGRRLFAVSNPSPAASLNDAIAVIEQNRLTLDLGNSLPTASSGGPRSDNGPLALVSQPGVNGEPYLLLGEIDYRAPGWHERTAGIVSFPLTQQTADRIAAQPLALQQLSTQLDILQENANGQWVRADQFVYRMSPNDAAEVKFYASQFGQPLPQAQISLTLDPSALQGQQQQGPIPGPTPGMPTQAMEFAKSLTTNASGQATLRLHAGDPGNPRGYIDGQVYCIGYQLGPQAPQIGSQSNYAFQISALIFDAYVQPATPDWMHDVRPILQQYADLYPIMRKIVDLSNYASLLRNIYALKNVFSAPEHDPNYMPVTRDLSPAKRKMLLAWLDHPVYMRMDSVEELKEALQLAIELEHATLPPYLTALFSIKPGCNTEVAALIRSVAMEEMLHMALMSNLLIAIGGKPRFNHARFIPDYPGSLPGGLRADLQVRLRKCSIEQLRAFMSIEQPAAMAEPVSGQITSADPLIPSDNTIAWFYDKITQSLTTLSQQGKIRFGHPERQVTDWPGAGQLYLIDSLETALQAIREIQSQGEGNSPDDPCDVDHELAHYYKFAQIVNGKRLVKTTQGYEYSGPEVPFDPQGVWPMQDDPMLSSFPPGSRARLLATQFNHSYHAMLNALHEAFNGEPTTLGQAVSLMRSLQLSVQQLVQTPSGRDDGLNAGPTFSRPAR
ncbi:ferritin-like protein [Chromobacterium sp. IIBBL 290-4]|uniref:ferritin-like domain-containing protein n=1 Tax=Chromobacterium sp. IIBBL 290-4 TaxID=2953890 RepID=UPI0020B7E647|nr:ferritin-like protein [Chromobacterium sp. IIBBL 290-4]UTH75093.1 ferritin-like protein [Chromobacterium sp. IIBBL 290-4]